MNRPIRRLALAALAAAVVIGGIAPSAAQTVQFTPLGVECGPAFFPTLCVVDMSGDGQTLLFRDRVWTADGQVLMIGAPPSGYFEVTALSDDGSTVVGNVYVTDGPLAPHFEAAIWLGGSDWRLLGYLPGSGPCGDLLTSAFDVSGDGSKVVGLAWLAPDCSDTAHGFQWTEETGMVDLGSIVDGRASRGNAISADGNVIGGWSDAEFGTRLGAQIRNGGAWEWITPDGAPIQAGEVLAVNSNGSILVGGGYNGPGPGPGPQPVSAEPWLWSEATGLIRLGSVKGLRGAVFDGSHYANDVSDDGTVVVGFDTLFTLGERWAFIWTKTGGIRMLQDYVRQYTDAATKAKICTAQRGPLQPCSKWDFATPAAISNDGKVIVGTGRNPAGNWEAFKVTLP
ncbi:MAG: hypothetical protein MUC67_01105 [Acidobacteria bacterium]|nr:hypothetical protein [Acidobacteriota bacterium]